MAVNIGTNKDWRIQQNVWGFSFFAFGRVHPIGKNIITIGSVADPGCFFRGKN
jgi:hypothetical protein